ncbi:hypothetical protein [Marinigracilibium pacificum]|uniref:Uncharacterized protein n=1 Tax=Marinigracilibium pacificum TaxID=2729599 RepID=A0A848IUX2_9BACT|nr:hypothetical protein [Marinigracilibium pacificum]NMM47486.1 hypothetical protein [Marinigracilibium pacificum]
MNNSLKELEIKEEVNYKLIDGQFSVEEAKEVLNALYRNKIRFHQEQRLSIYEREGRDTSSTELRIAELKTEREKVRDLLKLIESDEVVIQINGTIDVKILK